MKVKVEGQCFYHNRSVHLPGAVLDVHESYAGHPALVPFEPVVEETAAVASDAVSTATADTATEPVTDSPLTESQIQASVDETTAVDTASDGFDDVPNIPKTKTKKG